MNKRDYIISKFPGSMPNSRGTIHTRCPFHDDQKPSFSIAVESGFFVCRSISCGVRGNFSYFYKMMENIDSWKEVYDRLKENSSTYDPEELFKEKEIKSNIVYSNPFPYEPYVELLENIEYLEQRGLGQDVVQKFGLVYGKTGKFSNIDIACSIVCPVWDIDGTYRTFQVRYLNPKAKRRWLNPLGSPIQNLLYGGWAVNGSQSSLWIVEGASDTWQMFNLGVQAVGLNTKEASSAQLDKIVKLCNLLKLDPIVCLDGDAIKHGEKLRNELFASGFNVGFVALKEDEDPGGLTKERLDQVQKEIAWTHEK